MGEGAICLEVVTDGMMEIENSPRSLLKRENQCVGEDTGPDLFPNKKQAKEKDTSIDDDIQVKGKETSNDDIRSEVSNPNISPRENISSLQDITSKPAFKLAGSNQVECCEVSSTFTGDSGMEEALCNVNFSGGDNDKSSAVTTTHVVLEIPKDFSSSGIRKITFKFSKKKEDYNSQLSNPVPQIISNRTLSPRNFITNVKKLLATGILDGARVKYVSTIMKNELHGIIHGGGYLCGCLSCNFTRVLSAYEFEQHAGSKTRHPNNHIYLDNGKPIYNIIQELKMIPLSSLDEGLRNVAGSAVNEECLKAWKASLQKRKGLVGPEVEYKSSFNSSDPVLEGDSHTLDSFAQNSYINWLMETQEDQNYIMKKPSSFISLLASKQKKTSGSGGTRRRDNDLHKLLFLPNGLPDGAELTYYVKGQRILGGYKQGNGIVCNCCHKEISPSQFEAHAGMAARRQPYRHIYTSNGLTLHDIALSLSNGQKLTTSNSDDMCTICGDGGDLVLCDGCPCAFHSACLNMEDKPESGWHCSNCRDKIGTGRKTATGDYSIGRPIMIRLTRVVKAPEFERGGCVVCRAHDFSHAKFDERTVMLCDQCDREFHVGCLRESGLCDLKELPKDKWFCCPDCNRIHIALQKTVLNGEEKVPTSDLNTISRKHAVKGCLIDAAADDVQWRILSGKSRFPDHLRLLSRAAAIFRECFDPIVAKSGRDLIPVMVYGRNISGQEFSGMYCIVLSVKSVVVSAALLRIFGREVAELPLVATTREHQGKGYFQALFSCIEKLLYSMNVGKLVLPAAEEAESIWTNKFGFRKMTEDQVSWYMKQFQLTIFNKTSMLEKEVLNLTE